MGQTPDNKLRAACDDDFRQRIFDSEDYSILDTGAESLSGMK